MLVCSGEDNFPPPEARMGLQSWFSAGQNHQSLKDVQGKKEIAFCRRRGKNYTCAKNSFKEEAEAIKLFQETPFYTLQLLPR